jgi:adenylate kinase family enzyme
MLHTVIFIGRSGCGKGTQADLFRNWIHDHDPEKRAVLYVESGERFRQFIRGDGYSSKLSKEIYEMDERQPNFLGAWMWSTALIEELDEDMHIVFDGVARGLDEAQVLTTAINFYKRENTTVINLDVSRKWSEERLLARHRADDENLERIGKRLDWFERDSIPALDYLKSEPTYRFLEVNGEQSVEEVHRDIVEAYKAYGNKA